MIKELPNVTLLLLDGESIRGKSEVVRVRSGTKRSQEASRRLDAICGEHLTTVARLRLHLSTFCLDGLNIFTPEVRNIL